MADQDSSVQRPIDITDRQSRMLGVINTSQAGDIASEEEQMRHRRLLELASIQNETALRNQLVSSGLTGCYGMEEVR